MTHYDGSYLFTYSTNDNITLKRSRAMTDNWDNAEEKLLFNPNPSSGAPWATDVSWMQCQLTPLVQMFFFSTFCG